MALKDFEQRQQLQLGLSSIRLSRSPWTPLELDLGAVWCNVLSLYVNHKSSDDIVDKIWRRKVENFKFVSAVE